MNNQEKAVRLVEGDDDTLKFADNISVTPRHSVVVSKRPNGQLEYMAIVDQDAPEGRGIFRIESLEKLIELNKEFQILSRSGVSSHTFTPTTHGNIEIVDTLITMTPMEWVSLFDVMKEKFDSDCKLNRDITPADNSVELDHDIG